MGNILNNDNDELLSRFMNPSSQEEHDIAKAELIRRNVIDECGDIKEE